MVLTWCSVFPTVACVAAHYSVQRNTSAPSFWRIPKISTHCWWTISCSHLYRNVLCIRSSVSPDFLFTNSISCGGCCFYLNGVWLIASQLGNLDFFWICSPDFKNGCLLTKRFPQSTKHQWSHPVAYWLVPLWGLFFVRTAPFLGTILVPKKTRHLALVPSWAPQKVVLVFDSPGTMEFELRIFAIIPWKGTNRGDSSWVWTKNLSWKIFFRYVSIHAYMHTSMHVSI